MHPAAIPCLAAPALLLAGVWLRRGGWRCRGDDVCRVDCSGWEELTAEISEIAGGARVACMPGIPGYAYACRASCGPVIVLGRILEVGDPLMVRHVAAHEAVHLSRSWADRQGRQVSTVAGCLVMGLLLLVLPFPASLAGLAAGYLAAIGAILVATDVFELAVDLAAERLHGIRGAAAYTFLTVSRRDPSVALLNPVRAIVYAVWSAARRLVSWAGRFARRR